MEGSAARAEPELPEVETVTSGVDEGGARTVAQRREGVLDGEALVYGENGKISVRANYKNDLLDGASTCYDEDGELIQKAMYRAGVLDGEMLIYHAGSIQMASRYVAGKRQGEAVVYHEGALSSRLMYRNDRLEGRCIWYGPKAAIVKVSEFVGGKEEGPTLLYYPDGKVQERSNYRRGVLDGEVLSYHTNGELRRKAFYRAGVLEGDPQEFDQSGKPMGEGGGGGGWWSRVVGKLTLLLALAILVGCGPSIETRQVGFRVDPAANDRSPVPVELVIAYDEEIVPTLLELTARQWFERKNQLLLDHPTGLRSHLWELVPGQELPLTRLPLPRDGAVAAFVYADYLAPGPHRVRIDPFSRAMLRLTPVELIIEPANQ